MDNFSVPQNQEPLPGTISPSPTPPAPPPKKSRKRGIVIAILVVLVLAGLRYTGSMLRLFQTEQQHVTQTLDGFMSALARKEVSTAYAMLSTRAHGFVSESDVANLIGGSNFLLFDGYRSVAVGNITIGFQSGGDATDAQGIVVQTEGAVYYNGGFVGTFTATLEREGDLWKIHSFQVNAPPGKLLGGH